MSFQQWSTNTNQIPIDPALQQQQFTYGHPPATTTNPYTPPAFNTQYHQYQPPGTTSSTSIIQTQTQTQSRQSAASSVDTSDVSQLNDALGSAGVDLKAEEESLHRTHEQHYAYRIQEDRSRKQPSSPAFPNHVVGARMRESAKKHNNLRIPEEAVTYLALALRMRVQEVLQSAIGAAEHRRDSQPDGPPGMYGDGTPMWSMIVRRDVGKQLAVLERVEREEELRLRKERQERKDMAAAHTAGLAAQMNTATASNIDADMDMESGQPKKKKKKEGPGVTARNMSEDVRKKMSNAVASQAAGIGGKYSWMTAANANAPPPKPKTAANATSTPGAAGSALTTAPITTSTWARPYFGAAKPPTNQTTVLAATALPVPPADTRLQVTLKDAVFAIEKERGHGGGRGSARGFV